ncbi:hypothetical protein DW228_06385 [Bacteroides fragilis]|uniref:Uncharacterized protein n=1 Tax=Bacteroides fragilis TaxID=817 RepID=A0A396C1Q4_BACFG|nr:hypothetical protein [Bacteroides fragilis]RHH14425.1 hypothetical protein DW228_06385 [Bacteroides fragilis]
MASKVIYLAMRVEINDPAKNKITDKDVDKIVSEVDYEFKDLDNFKLDTEIHSLISPEQL